MRVVVVLGLLVACGGDGSGTDVGTTDTTSVPTGPLCEELPQYDLAPMSCAQVADAFEDTVDLAQGCATADDCMVLDSPCENWNEVGCWYVVNPDCLSQSDANEFVSAASGCASTQVCSCSGGVPDVDCVGGKCQLVDTY